jgi:hypothetical protein
MARRVLGITLVAAAVCSGASALARADAFSTPRRIDDDNPLAGFVRGALQGAQQRMARPKCQQVLFDFTDASGRSLRENLDVVGGAPDAFLGKLLFYDGSEHPRCGNPRVLAFTSPGNRAIFICRAQFMRKRTSNRLFSELVLIHEALHSLGLAENPPSLSEITQQVRARCGS